MLGCFIAAVALAASPEAECRAHWQAHGSAINARYLTLAPVPQKSYEDWQAAMCFQVPSASREELLDHQIPQRIGETPNYVIDIFRLGWDGYDLAKVLEKYPYSAKVNPLTIRADWLVKQLADARDSDAYYRLLYGGKNIPKTAADFLKFWKADKRADMGWVETRSQVAKQDSRFVERFNAAGHSLWRTKDVVRVKRGSDPLEALDGAFAHDAEELIGQISKVSIYQRSRGALQVYLLANGQGKRQDEAPVRIVQDYSGVLGNPAITTGASCTACHVHGMISPTENGLEASLKSGVQLKVYDYRKQEQVEAFHLTDVGKQLRRDSEDYEVAVKACNGLTGAENAEAYKKSLAQYRADLGLTDCARELYVAPEELKLAIAYASANAIDVGPRVAGLVHGRNVSRDSWEADYLRAQAMLSKWQAVH